MTKTVKRAPLIWAASIAIGFAQGDVSSEFQNAPQQPSQNPPQPAPPQPAPPQPADGGARAKSAAQSGPNAGGSSFLGKDVPFFTIDSLANEIMRDVREGVQAFKFLLERTNYKAPRNGSRKPS
jgi:hypothetical protein